jgi:hypothetical protein
MNSVTLGFLGLLWCARELRLGVIARECHEEAARCLLETGIPKDRTSRL